MINSGLPLQPGSRNSSSNHNRALKGLSTGLRESVAVAKSEADYTTADGIVRFVREVLKAEPTPYQEDILRHFILKRRAAVRGPHGLGKTALSSWVILWGVSVFPNDVKVVTTASAWRQLTHFTWPEVRKWAAVADWSKVGLTMRRGKELLEYSIKLEGKEAFPVASDNPALIEGAHAKHLIYVFDEAKSIPAESWDAAEGAFSGAGSDTDSDAYALAISTPGATSGRFYDIHKRKPGYSDWWVRHVTTEEAIAAKRISREWVDNRKKQWGEQSAIYQNRVAGEFSDSADDSVIPLSWCEQAVERWYACEGKGTGDPTYGVDPARFGDDKTTIARKVGRVVENIEVHTKEDTMQTAGRVASKLKPNTPCGVDVIGIGAGVFDRLRELGFKGVTAVNVAESANMPNGKPITDNSGELLFENLRAAIWWMLREALDPSNPDALALPPDEDDILIGDLTAPLYDYTSRGKIKVESKEDVKKRINRSTDYADGVGLAVYVDWLAQRPKPLSWRELNS